MATLMSACPSCGRQIDQTARRCQHCGHLARSVGPTGYRPSYCALPGSADCGVRLATDLSLGGFNGIDENQIRS
jgi:hypothetical protein